MAANNPPIAEGVKDSVDNLSFAELLTQRAGVNEESETNAEAEETEEPEDDAQPESHEPEQAEESEESEEPEEEAEEEDEPQSDIDLLNLTPEQIQELARKGKSRLLERIGELTAKNKALEEKLSSSAVKPNQEVPQETNPFRDLESIEAIQSKYKEFEQTLETTDQILEEHEDYGPDDIISVGDKEFTKKQIRKANRNAREAITKYLPAQHQHLVKLTQINQMAEQYMAAAKKEVPEIQDEASEIGKQFKALAADPLIERVKKEIPELGMQVEYILAHAVRSIHGKTMKTVPTGAGKKLKANPPSSPVGAGAAKSTKSAKGRIQDALNRFENSGSVDDWIAARSAQLR
jgi:hypothetical protein